MGRRQSLALPLLLLPQLHALSSSTTPRPTRAAAAKPHQQRRLQRRRDDRAALVERLREPEPRVLRAPAVDWAALPAHADPARGGRLKGRRAARKRVAVEAFAAVTPALLADTDASVVVDVGCGAGGLTSPLASFANARVIGVDVLPEPLRLLRERSGGAVETLELDALALADGKRLRALGASCVVSLHACGAVSDLAMDGAVAAGLPFAVSPCCIGKSLLERGENFRGRMPTSSERSARPPSISYPRSASLGDRCTATEYAIVASIADYGVGEGDPPDVVARQRRAKRIVETDRLGHAAEKGYDVRLLDMMVDPLYPKRELLLGAPCGSRAAAALAALETVKSPW